jgi:hypothetical protein
MAVYTCPFCGDPHPAADDEDPDFDATPGCKHHFGRYDPDGTPGNDEYPKLTGYLSELDDLKLPTHDGSAEPSQPQLEAAFGEELELARAAYPDGFNQPGASISLYRAVITRLNVSELWITGSMVWSCCEYYAAHPEAEAKKGRELLAAVQEGIQRLNELPET